MHVNCFWNDDHLTLTVTPISENNDHIQDSDESKNWDCDDEWDLFDEK